MTLPPSPLSGTVAVPQSRRRAPRPLVGLLTALCVAAASATLVSAPASAAVTAETLSLKPFGSVTSARTGALTNGTASAAIVVSQLPVGGPEYLSVQLRASLPSSAYRSRVKVYPDGRMDVGITRVVNGREEVLGNTAIAGRVAAGQTVHLDGHVAGAGAATAVDVRAWLDGAARPAWQQTYRDTTATTTVANAPVSVWAYLSGAARATSVKLTDLQVVQDAPPVATLTGAPTTGSVQTSRSAAVTFSANVPGSVFECSLDGGAWQACASPATFGSLTLDVHQVRVRALAAAGATPGPVAQSGQFTVVSGTPGQVRPTEANTGVPAGTSLTVYEGDLVVTTAGAVIDSLDVHGRVRIQAPNVTMRRTIVRGGAAPTSGNPALVTNLSTGFVMEDSEVVPTNTSVYLDGIRGSSMTLRRVEARGTVDNVKVVGSDVVIESSLLHQTQYYASDPAQGGGPSHNDGVQIFGGTNVSLVGNRIEDSSNAAVQVSQSVAPVVGLVINGNWADNGGCTVNLAHKGQASMSTVTVRGNRFGHDTSVANCPIIATSATTLAASDNVYEDTNAAAVPHRG